MYETLLRVHTLGNVKLRYALPPPKFISTYIMIASLHLILRNTIKQIGLDFEFKVIMKTIRRDSGQQKENLFLSYSRRLHQTFIIMIKINKQVLSFELNDTPHHNGYVIWVHKSNQGGTGRTPLLPWDLGLCCYSML